MKEKVLVGLDDSEKSWDAFSYVLMKSKEGCFDEITVVHSEEESGDKEYRTGEEILERAKRRAREENVEVNTKLLVRGYEPDVDIVRFAEEEDYDHIIIGHTGRSGIGGMLLGSVAESILENSNCVVTTVRSAPYIDREGKLVRAKEIENILEGHPGVKDAVVLETGAGDSKSLVAFFSPTEGYEPPSEMIMSYVEDLADNGEIDEIKVPDRIEALDKFPRTEAGTVNRDKLKDEYL